MADQMNKQEFMVAIITLATSLEQTAQVLRLLVAEALDEDNRERFDDYMGD